VRKRVIIGLLAVVVIGVVAFVVSQPKHPHPLSPSPWERGFYFGLRTQGGAALALGYNHAAPMGLLSSLWSHKGILGN
jgi:hypothetical protein